MEQKDRGGTASPLQFVKVLSWSFFLIILGASLGLSVFISNYAERTLLEKQKQFGLLLAENLNHQIYTRFTLPTVIGYGAIRLKNKEQYERLDQVIRTTVHSFHVQSLRVFDYGYVISYSLNKDEVGTKDAAPGAVEKAMEKEEHSFKFMSHVSPLAALFMPSLKPGTVVLKTYYPLRAERRLGTNADNPIMGIVEFTQDITEDYAGVVAFERVVVGTSLFTSVIIFMIIMTVLRRAERLNRQRLEEKERLERELLEQEKLAGMGRMVAGVAHEIRNPLGIIRSSAELVLKKMKKEESPHTRILEALFSETKRLQRVVNDFLDYARPKRPRQDDVDLGRVLDQVVVFLETECEKKQVKITRAYTPGLVVKGDKDLLYRAFFNIVSNALQAMTEPGEITVVAAQEEDGVHVSVQDTGPGFPEENLGRLKDPFFTTRDNGTGLGLAIVDNIVESHGAKLYLSCGVVNGQPGGARVDMIFPEQ